MHPPLVWYRFGTGLIPVQCRCGIGVVPIGISVLLAVAVILRVQVGDFTRAFCANDRESLPKAVILRVHRGDFTCAAGDSTRAPGDFTCARR